VSPQCTLAVYLCVVADQNHCCPLLQARQVLRWKNDKPVLAEKVWDTLAGANTEIFDTLEEMNNQYRVRVVMGYVLWYLRVGFFCFLYRQILLTRIFCELFSFDLKGYLS
jgi:hypothetical protein